MSPDPTPFAMYLQTSGLTPEKLARELNRRHGAGTVGQKSAFYWKRPGKAPKEPALQVAVARLLGDKIGRDLAVTDLWPHLETDAVVRADDGLDRPWTQEGTRSAIAEIIRRPLMDARTLTPLVGSALTRNALDWLLQEPPPLREQLDGARVSDTMLDVIDARIGDLRRLDDEQGGGQMLLDLAMHDLRWVGGLIKNGTYDTAAARRLHAATAELAQFAGWIAFDSGDHPEAQRLWMVALRAAHTVGDDLFGAHVLSSLGYQSVWTNHAEDAVVILRTGRAGIRRHRGRVYALLASRQARGHALLGQEREMQASLEAAAAAAANGAEADPKWSYWITDAVLTGDRGRSWLDVGRPDRAVRELESGLAAFGTSQPRNRALHHTSIALAYSTQGEYDAAAAATHQALDLANALASDRIYARIAELAPALSATDAAPAVEAVARVRDTLSAPRGVR